MAVIIFHRGDFWYPTEYPETYANWTAEAERNPGTTKIVTEDGAVLWPADQNRIATEAWEAARALYDAIMDAEPMSGESINLIARAILAAEKRGEEREREACALNARAAFDDRPRREGVDWNDGFDDGTKAAAAAIRKRGEG